MGTSKAQSLGFPYLCDPCLPLVGITATRMAVRNVTVMFGLQTETRRVLSAAGLG